MNIETVRSKIVLGFSAVILLMVALCAFAYTQLRGIETQSEELRASPFPDCILPVDYTSSR